jgi:DNA-binding NarL/FixJ family response regulator
LAVHIAQFFSCRSPDSCQDAQNRRPEARLSALNTLSVLIAHHLPILRFGLTALVNMNRQFKVVGATGAAPEARRLFTEKTPDLVVVSLTLKHGDGIALIKDFRKWQPATPTMVFTTRTDLLSVQRAFKAGARGYVVTKDETDEILHALGRIAAGEVYASSTVAQALVKMLANGSIDAPRDRYSHLSDRELQVFRLIGSGLGVSQIATELQLSRKTIETHRLRMKQKLGLATSRDLTRRAAEWMLDAARESVRWTKINAKNRRCPPKKARRQ